MMPGGQSDQARWQVRLEGRLASRKFWMAASTGVFLAGLGIIGAVAWEFLVDKWIMVVIGYLGVQGGLDALGRWKGW
jgi:hypothetical protein